MILYYACFVNKLGSELNPEMGMNIGLEFQINMYAASGLKVDSLRLFHEAYKPYKVQTKIYILCLYTDYKYIGS